MTQPIDLNEVSMKVTVSDRAHCRKHKGFQADCLGCWSESWHQVYGIVERWAAEIQRLLAELEKVKAERDAASRMAHKMTDRAIDLGKATSDALQAEPDRLADNFKNNLSKLVAKYRKEQG